MPQCRGAAAPEMSVEKVIYAHTRCGGLIHSLLDHRLKKTIDMIARNYLSNGSARARNSLERDVRRMPAIGRGGEGCPSPGVPVSDRIFRSSVPRKSILDDGALRSLESRERIARDSVSYGVAGGKASQPP